MKTKNIFNSALLIVLSSFGFTASSAVADNNPAGKLQFIMDNHQAKTGDEITVPVRVKDFKDMLGYQFTVNWDATVLSLLDVKNISVEGYYGSNRNNEGMLTTLWDSETAKAIALNDDAVAFELKFKVIGATGSQSEINIGSEITPAEAYNGNFEVLDVAPTNGMVKVGDATALNTQYPTLNTLQVLPNPFANSTQIMFGLPQDASVNIVIYDLMGKQVKQIQSQFSAGNHQVEWMGDDNTGKLLSKGLYHVRMRAGDFNAVAKVALVRW